MDIYASDDEKAEEIKQWWRENGLSVIIGVVLGVTVLFAGRYWLTYKHTLAENAAAQYQQMMTLAANGKHSEARDKTQALLSDYASTPYAVFAAIEMASEDVKAGDESSAKTYLEWVIQHAQLAGHIEIARLRLAQLLLNEENYEQAIALCEQSKAESFKSLFAELKGDIYAAQGKKAEALAAYQAALSDSPAAQSRQVLLKMKIDDVAVANEG